MKHLAIFCVEKNLFRILITFLVSLSYFSWLLSWQNTKILPLIFRNFCSTEWLKFNNDNFSKSSSRNVDFICLNIFLPFNASFTCQYTANITPGCEHVIHKFISRKPIYCRPRANTYTIKSNRTILDTYFDNKNMD